MSKVMPAERAGGNNSRPPSAGKRRREEEDDTDLPPATRVCIRCPPLVLRIVYTYQGQSHSHVMHVEEVRELLIWQLCEQIEGQLKEVHGRTLKVVNISARMDGVRSTVLGRAKVFAIFEKAEHVVGVVLENARACIVM